MTTEVPVDLFIDGRPAAKLYHSGTLTLDLPDGPHGLTVYRGEGAEDLAIEVGPTPLVVRVGSHLLEANEGVATVVETDATTGSLVLRLVDSPGATIVWQGERHRIAADGSLRFEALAPGAYPIEARSADSTYIWMRGTLHVEAGDELVMALSEGRPPETFGRAEAWQPDR